MTLESIDLKQFIGSTVHYRHWSRLVYTEGVQYLAHHGGAYWLIDAIASYQPRLMKDPMLKDFQYWVLQVNPDNRPDDRSAWLSCYRNTDDVALTQKIPFTDFPLSTVKLYLADGVLMLPSEY